MMYCADKPESRKRIQFLIPSLRGGGAERVITLLLKHLDRGRFQLSLVVVDMDGAVFRNDIPADVQVIDFGVKRLRYALPKIIALIWRQRPDVVFVTLSHLNLALSICRFLLPNRVRYIARETNIVSDTLQVYSHPDIWAFLYRRFYHLYDRLVCQSSYMREDLVRRFDFPLEKTVVINNPVDVEHIRKLATTPLDYPDFPEGCICLVAAGRLSEQKGFDILIDALSLVDHPKINLYILGEGLLQDELKQLANSKGVANQIEFVGFQINPYAWFARADAFVLSSRYEGFPNVVLEALACGTPVIATPVLGGIREILDDVSGCVIAKEVSATALADALGEWMAGHRRRIPKLAVAPYRLERIIGQFEKILST